MKTIKQSFRINQGFTIIETMVSVGILAVVLSIAAPSLGNVLRSNDTCAAARLFKDHLQEAKSYSKSLSNTQVTFCAVGIAAGSKSTCFNEDSNFSFQNGWQWFEDTDADGVLDNGETVLGRTSEFDSDLTSGLAIDNAVSIVVDNVVQDNRISYRAGVATIRRSDGTSNKSDIFRFRFDDRNSKFCQVSISAHGSSTLLRTSY
ncbi:MAG: type IV fimbrial biogenesis protein FimT [Saprospiraceae bacterium]